MGLGVGIFLIAVGAILAFAIHVTTTGVDQLNKTLHFSDNISKVLGAHTVRVGSQGEDLEIQVPCGGVFAIE